jgi:hypothetical protein
LSFTAQHILREGFAGKPWELDEELLKQTILCENIADVWEEASDAYVT